jgi:cyclopropane-fatty-acyl-phospholipid synthase
MRQELDLPVHPLATGRPPVVLAAPRVPGRLEALFGRVAARRLEAGLQRWSVGRLTIGWPDGRTFSVGAHGAEPHVTMRIHDVAVFRKFTLRGDLGAGEAYMDGDWSTDDLPRFVELMLRNRHCVELDSHVSRVVNLTNDLLHRARANTRSGSRRNISRHYDLSNDFFSLFLDETMTYSSAVFGWPGEPLADAQRRKYRSLADKLQLEPGHRVLEIGCGWGGFALLAAREYGVRVTGITVSQRQHDLARQRVREAGLEDRVAIQLCDYRDVQGTFDRIVSIEMLEAVGREYWGQFLATCDRTLTAGGRAAVQTIAIADRRFDQYARHCDWIQRYIFPGGLLPSLLELCKAASVGSRLGVFHLEDIALDYARTLALWRARFFDRIPEVRALGFDDRFIRMWDYYLSTCEAAFATRSLSTYQLVFARDGEDLQ